MRQHREACTLHAFLILFLAFELSLLFRGMLGFFLRFFLSFVFATVIAHDWTPEFGVKHDLVS